MTDDLHAERCVVVTEEFKRDVGDHVIARLIGEATDQVRRAVIDDAERRYPCPIPHGIVDIKMEEEREHAPREIRYHIRATIRGRDIEHAIRTDAMMKHPIVAYEPSKFMYNETPQPHSDTKLLKAILDEALPNWRDVYDRLERAENEAKWRIDPFRKAYFARSAGYKGLRADTFIREDYAGKGEDYTAKK